MALMTNNKQQTAVDSIIEFCQKQMENDSSIHKGVYLSIIKFCKEQITEESEIHWKTTLLTMTNNKQQSK
jgi:phage FluMu gp28-like protein